MESMDIDDFIEEVKFQLTEYDVFEEKDILGWEKKARAYIMKQRHNKNVIVKSEDEVWIKVHSNDLMEKIALEYYRAFRDKKIDEYWKNFKL